MADYLASIFGTEKDKVNCSFYFKIGACRHGERCSRIHNKPTFSQTILLQNLYQNPQNVTSSVDPLGKETTITRVNTMSEEDAQEHFDDFFEDVFVELEDKYGEIEEMNVCDNLGDHLVGNVYVKFRSEEDAERAVNELGDRWFGGRPIHAELSPVTDFREACCRQYEMGECTRSGFCNFMHLKPISRELRRELYGRRRAAALERRIASYIGGGADRSITATTTRGNRGGRDADLDRNSFGRDEFSSRDRDRGDRGGRSDRGDRGGDSKRHGSRDRDSRRRRRSRSGSKEATSKRRRSRSKERSGSRSKKHHSSRRDKDRRDRSGDREGHRTDRGGGEDAKIKTEDHTEEDGDKAILGDTVSLSNGLTLKIEPKDGEDNGENVAPPAASTSEGFKDAYGDDYGSYNPAPPPIKEGDEEDSTGAYGGYDHHQHQASSNDARDLDMGISGAMMPADEDDGYGAQHHYSHHPKEDHEEEGEHYRHEQQFNNGLDVYGAAPPAVKPEEDSYEDSNSNSNQMMTTGYGYSNPYADDDDD